MSRRRATGPRVAVLGLGLAGAACASGPGVRPAAARPLPLAQEQPAPSLGDSTRRPIVPPAVAAGRGWMPLASGGVPAFRAAHPTYDGRGVLIAILDSGLDPSVPGLDRTSTGTPKVVELRDLSGEGRVRLAEVLPAGDAIRVGAGLLRGAGRLRALSTGGRFFAGGLSEVPLGDGPAADLNGNGAASDTLAVVVTRASDGWVLFADTDGDGSLANERPVRDYRVAQEVLGWSTGGRPAPIGVAVNFAEAGDGVPRLDLVFDNSGHGTHVAGIAAGHALYGISGFDGVAPGAELLGVKIANDARGGITVTGSMLEAAAYAIRYAEQRRMPLVINLSFGVGNEAEGRARIDLLLDSLLAQHPEVIAMVSAGNDGPGLSTIGFPGSARRVLSVGASYPGVFLPPDLRGRSLADRVAFFSSRGGEAARPDLVAPGVAYSTVPAWNVGDEVKNGTSMAAPFAAGLAASLASGLLAEGRPITAAAINRALLGSARLLPGGTALDQGAGEPDLARAWDLLRVARPAPAAEPIVDEGLGGAMVFLEPGAAADTLLRFRLRHSAPGQPVTYTLRSNAPWLEAPASVSLGADLATVALRARVDQLMEPGVSIGLVTGWGPDSATGPAFRLTAAVIRPRPLDARGGVDTLRFDLPAGGLHRLFLGADSARAFRVMTTEDQGAPLLAFLHQPGGMPAPDRPVAVAGGADGSEAVLEVDGRDAVAGAYEVVVLAGPTQGASPQVLVDPSPLRFGLRRARDSVVLEAANLTASAVDGAFDLEFLGAERGITASSAGSDDVRYPIHLPAWTRRVVVDLSFDRDQWPLFTDFGLTIEDPEGRVLEASPVNYATGRLTFEVERPAAREVVLVLSPGFADPGASARWYGALAVRLYAEDPVPISQAGGIPVHLGPGQSGRWTTGLPPMPWPLDGALHPLARARFRAGDRVWRREAGLPLPLPPVMR